MNGKRLFPSGSNSENPVEKRRKRVNDLPEEAIHIIRNGKNMKQNSEEDEETLEIPEAKNSILFVRGGKGELKDSSDLFTVKHIESEASMLNRKKSIHFSLDQEDLERLYCRYRTVSVNDPKVKVLASIGLPGPPPAANYGVNTSSIFEEFGVVKGRF